jgi:hypothetical protein
VPKVVPCFDEKYLDGSFRASLKLKSYSSRIIQAQEIAPFLLDPIVAIFTA